MIDATCVSIADFSQKIPVFTNIQIGLEQFQWTVPSSLSPGQYMLVFRDTVSKQIISWSPGQIDAELGDESFIITCDSHEECARDRFCSVSGICERCTSISITGMISFLLVAQLAGMMKPMP